MSQVMKSSMDAYVMSFEKPISTHHVFGYMSGLMQQVGSFDFGQHLVVDALNQP